MLKQRLTYWLPRVFVVSFAVSLVLPAPGFLARMEPGERIVWLARLIWVLGLPAVFCLACLLMILLGSRNS